MKKLLVIFSIIAIASLAAAGAVFAKGMECKQDARGICVPTCTMACCANSECGKMPANVAGANINDTASIKEMQAKKCPAKCYAKTDALGNRVSSQTDNSGKLYLGIK